MENQNLGFVAGIDHSGFDKDAKHIQESVEQVAKKVEQSGMSVDEFAKHMQSLLSSFDRLTQAVDKNTSAQENAMSAGKKAADVEKQSADNATDAIKTTGKATDELGRKLKNTGDEGSEVFGKLQKAAAGFFTLAAAKEFGQKVFEVRSEIQSLQTSFETLVGNKPQAEELFSSIKDFATHTPMQLKDLASAAQTMMSFNIPVEQIMVNLKALGDVSMGDAQKFQSLSLAFSQMSATGKLMGQDLLQMINAGFNPLATISEKTGKSIEKLKDEMSKGAISADMVRQAFIDATSEGGKFHGMLEAKSKTLEGAYSNLQGAISDMYNAIGEQSEGIMAGAIDAATVLVQNYEKIGKVLLQLVAVYGSYKVAVMTNIALEKAQAINRLAHIKGVTAMQLATDVLIKKTAALNAVLMKNPYVLLGTVVMSAITAYALFSESTDEVAMAQKRLNGIKDEAAKKVEEEKDKIEELRKVAKNEYSSLKARQDAINQLNSIIPNYNAQLDATTGKYIENKKALDDYLVSLARKYELEGAKDQLRQIGKEIAQTRLEIAKAKEDVEGAKNLQGKVGRSAAYNPAESQFLTSNTSFAENELDNANKRLSVKLKERKLIYDTFGEDLIQDANNVADSTPPPLGDGKKGSKKGEKDDLSERAARMIEEELRYQDELRKIHQEASDTRRDAEIASIQNNAERERAEQDEQHERNLRQIKEQANEMRKAIYEHNKREWENAHKDSPYENIEAGKAGWMGLQLSDDQQATIDALIQKENAEYLRLVDERHKKELSASYEFLKQYGDYEQQKLAITKEYEQKIQEASTPAEKAALSAQQDKELKELSKKELEDTIDWAGVFNDLSGHTEKYLLGLREQLQNLLKTGDLPIDQMATIQAKVREIDEELNKQGGIFSHMSDAQREHNRRLAEAKDAQEALNAALNEQFNAQMSVNIATSNASELLKGLGLSLGDVTQDSSLLDEVAAKFGGKDSDVYKKVEAAITKVRTAETKLSEARNNVAKNAPKWKKAQDAVNEGFKDMVARVADNIKEWVNYYLGDLPGLLSEIGLNSASEKASQGLSAVNNAAGAAADFASGNYVGAALKAVSAVKDFGRVLGIGGGNAAEINKQLARLSERNEILTQSIDKLTQVMSGKSGASAIKEYEKVADMQKELEDNLKKQMQLQMQYHSAHGSFNSYWGSGFSAAEIAEFNKRHGTNWSGNLNDLNADLASLLMGEADMWQKINDTGKGGYGGRVAEKIKELAEQAGKAKEQTDALYESLTAGTTRENVFDDFLNSLYDLADGSEDVMENIAKNWQQMVNHMVINNLIGAKMQQDLEKWYEELAELNRKRTEDGSTMTDDFYKSELERLQDDYTSLVESGQQQIEQFREMGIIKTIEETDNAAREYFSNLRDSWLSTLTDMTADGKAWREDILRTMFEDLVDATVLNVPVTVNGQTFDDFEAYLKDWTSRYKTAVEAGDIEAMKALADEQAALREEQAEKSKALAESLGYEVKEALSSSLDNLGDTLLNSLLDANADAEEIGEEIGATLVKEMLQTMLASEKYSTQIDAIKEKWQQVLAGENTDEAGNTLFTMTDVLNDIAALNNEIAADEGIAALAEQYRELSSELGKTDSAFKNLHGTFSDALADMEGDAEAFRKNIEQTMLKDLIERRVFEVPLTVNDKEFKDFDAYVTDWNKRYEENAKAGNQTVLDAMLDELSAVRERMIESVSDYRERLKKINSDTTFSGMSDSFASSLMDMNKKAEDVAEDIGQTIARKIIEQMVVSQQVQPLLDNLQKAFNTAMADGATWQTAVNDTGMQIAMEQIKEAFPELQGLAKGILDSLGIKEAKEGFSDLKGTFVSMLTDMETDAEKLGKNIGKSMIEQMIETLVDKKYKKQIEELNNEWADALEAGDTEKIESLRKAVVSLYDTIGKDESLKTLAADLKAITKEAEDTPLHGLRSTFLSDLMSMENDTQAFAENINKILTEAFIDKFVLGNAFDEQLENWEKRYGDIMGADISEEERSRQLKALQETITAARDDYAEQARAIQDFMGTSQYGDQQAAVNMADKATYDQFEMYLGIATAQQIALEQGNDVRRQILATLQAMSGITTPGSNIGAEISGKLNITNEYLLTIRNYCATITETFAQKLDYIGNKLARF